jgi:hypothetical protein
MLINPAGIPKTTEYVKIIPPMKIASTDGNFKTRNRRGTGKVINSAPIPTNVQPSILVMSPSMFNLRETMGTNTSSEKMKIRYGMFF